MPPRKLILAVTISLFSSMLAACNIAIIDQQPTQVPPTIVPTVPIAQSSPLPYPTKATPALPPQGTIIVGSERSQSLTLIASVSNQIAKVIQLGAPAHGIAVAPNGRDAWIFSGRRGEEDFYVADLIGGLRTGTTRLGGSPSAASFTSSGNRAYVALEDVNAIAFLTMPNRAQFGRLSLGRQTADVYIRRQPSALAFVHKQSDDILYVAAHGSGTIWALDGGSGNLLAEIEVGGGPIRLLPDPSGNRVHALIDTLDQLVTIDSTTQKVLSRLNLPGRASSAAIGPSGIVYVTGVDAGEVWVIEPFTTSLQSRIDVGSQPSDVVFSADGGRAYVSNRAEGTLSIIDVPTEQVIATMPVGEDLATVAFVPAAGAIAGNVLVPPASNQAAPDTITAPTSSAPIPTLWPSPTPLPPGAHPPEQMPTGATKEVFVPGAKFPVALAFAPDGRLFYNELQTGRIRIVQNGSLLPDPFYQFAVAGEPETGLIGLALDPDFAQNHYVYVFYTQVANGGTQSGGANGPNQVVRLTEINGRGTDLTPIVRDLPSGPVHNAGALGFGPDDKLYISLGDNENGNNSQNLSTMAGKILRVNRDGSIPLDNPFSGQPDKKGAIWAYGLRNSFGLAFHPLSGGLFATENGPGDNDELNIIVKGGNYGWPPSGFQDKPGVIDPIEVINSPIAPSGITFYTGNEIRDWNNDLFYCNYHQGELRRIRLAPESFDRIVFEEVVTSGCTLDVVTGPDSALYFSDMNAIYRIRKEGASALRAVPIDTGPAQSPTPQLPGGTKPQDRDINVSLSEWKLQPSRTVAPAGHIRFLAENVGRVAHALRVVGNGVDIRTDTIAPGASQQLEIDLAPGTYELSCPLPGHAEDGMVSSLSVVGH